MSETFVARIYLGGQSRPVMRAIGDGYFERWVREDANPGLGAKRFGPHFGIANDAEVEYRVEAMLRREVRLGDVAVKGLGERWVLLRLKRIGIKEVR